MPIWFCIKYKAECFVQDKKMLPNDGANHSVMYLLSLEEGTIQSEILFPVVTIAVKKNLKSFIGPRNTLKVLFS